MNKKAKMFTKLTIIGIFIVEIIILASGYTINHIDNIRYSYDAIKVANVINHIPFNNFLFSNNELSFLYSTINNEVSDYPKTVPNLVGLPVDILTNIIDSNERIKIDYVSDSDHRNGIIIAQNPEAGTSWGNDVLVNLTVNRKYDCIHSKFGYIEKSIKTLFFASNDSIMDRSEKIMHIDNLIRLHLNNEILFYNDLDGINAIYNNNLVKHYPIKALNYFVLGDSIYYIDRNNGYRLFCYNMNRMSNELVFNKAINAFFVNANYIICRDMHSIIIIDIHDNMIIKEINSTDLISDLALDSDNVYYLQRTINSSHKQKWTIEKYNINTKISKTIYTSKDNEMISYLYAIDNQVVFLHYLGEKVRFGYIDTENMEYDDFIIQNKGNILDVLFDGQQIIYKSEEEDFYSISVFTGKIIKLK